MCVYYYRDLRFYMVFQTNEVVILATNFVELFEFKFFQVVRAYA